MSNKKQAEQALRKKAEEISRTTAKELPTNLGEMSTEEVRLLLHELQVHQIELEMQNTELRRTQEELDAERRRYFDLYDIAPVGYCTVSEEGLLLEANLAAINLLGVTRNTLPGQRMSRFILEEDQNGYYLFRRNLFASGQPQSCELRMVKKDKTIFSAHLAAVLAGGVSSAPVCRIVLSDISERKEAEEELKKIKWMLTSKQPLSASVPPGKDIEDQGYGDLTALNRGGLISRSIDKEILRDISTEYLNLLETSSAIYEKNGDYAYGIFCSGWCRLMDGASRKLCHTEDNEFALASGKWLCHESCWTNCSQRAIESRSPVDIECSGGIHLYAVPIFSAGEVIGAINFGYGDPPKDTAKLRSLAEAYAVDPKKLALEADAYASRPTYIVELAKQRLLSSARLVGIMVERKQAEEALREQSDFSESLIETAQVIILVLDTQGRIVRFNHYMEQLVGYDLDEVKGMDWFETFLTPEIDPTIKPLFQKTVADIHTSGNVNPIVAKDGRLILVEWYNKILKDKEGRTVGVLAIGQDITERTQAEAALKESQKRFHQIFLDHNAIMLLVNPETGVIQEANPAAANFYGHSTEQLRRMTIEDINTLSAEEVARHRSQAIAGAGNYFIFPHRLADGQIRTVEVYSSPIAFNSETLLFSIIHDISERKQAELEVQKLNVELEQRIADRTEDLRNSQLALLNVVDDLNLHAKNSMSPTKSWKRPTKNWRPFPTRSPTICAHRFATSAALWNCSKRNCHLPLMRKPGIFSRSSRILPCR
jgi:PAS domain S-box-containing protein